MNNLLSRCKLGGRMGDASTTVVSAADLVTLIPCIVTAILSAATLIQTYSLKKRERNDEIIDKRIDIFMRANDELNAVLPNELRIEDRINNMNRYDATGAENDDVVFRETNGEVVCINEPGCYVTKTDLQKIESCASDNMAILGNHISRYRFLYPSEIIDRIEQIFASWNDAPKKESFESIIKSLKSKDEPDEDDSRLYPLNTRHLIKPIQVRYLIVRHYESALREMLNTGSNTSEKPET